VTNEELYAWADSHPNMPQAVAVKQLLGRITAEFLQHELPRVKQENADLRNSLEAETQWRIQMSAINERLAAENAALKKVQLPTNKLTGRVGTVAVDLNFHGCGSIKVDNREVACYVSEINIKAKAGEVPVVTLDIFPVAGPCAAVKIERDSSRASSPPVKDDSLPLAEEITQ